MKNYIEIIIPVAESETRDILCAMLAAQAFDGFEETPIEVKAYIPEENFSAKSLKEILEIFQLGFTAKLIPAQNWNEVWESNFQPITVDDFVAVRADFHKPILNTVHEIIITPKMSFGTGHHATTFMMMQQMGQFDFRNKSVFDFGTGTGILAILAEKMGAASVTAVDNDDWSITNAAENISRNGCKKIELYSASTPGSDKKFEIILANINKNIILEWFHKLADNLTINGLLLLSGLLIEDEQDILKAASSLNLSLISTITKDKWICIVFSN